MLPRPSPYLSKMHVASCLLLGLQTPPFPLLETQITRPPPLPTTNHAPSSIAWARNLKGSRIRTFPLLQQETHIGEELCWIVEKKVALTYVKHQHTNHLVIGNWIFLFQVINYFLNLFQCQLLVLLFQCGN